MSREGLIGKMIERAPAIALAIVGSLGGLACSGKDARESTDGGNNAELQENCELGAEAFLADGTYNILGTGNLSTGQAEIFGVERNDNEVHLLRGLFSVSDGGFLMDYDTFEQIRDPVVIGGEPEFEATDYKGRRIVVDVDLDGDNNAVASFYTCSNSGTQT
jgi:hypothetical protein